jgi:hypothetical protein
MHKDELHRRVDDSITNIVKNIGNIFDKIKFNEVQIVEETNNLELLSSMEAISNRLKEMSTILVEMKSDHLKFVEYENTYKKNKQKDIVALTNFINQRLTQLQESYNQVNYLLRENKTNKFYKYSLNYSLE